MTGPWRGLVLSQLAQRLAGWLEASGWTPEDLAAAVDRGPAWLLAALDTVPAWQQAALRQWAGPWLAQLDEQDLWDLLKVDALHPRWSAHVAVLATPERWPRVWAAWHTVLRDWLGAARRTP
jgi:hypothetical protein